MKALHLILPPLARFAGLPEFRRWLARGDRLTDAPRGRQAAYRELFKFPGTSLPMAALLREHCAGDAGENVWLCADPAHVQAEAAGARLLACGDDLQLAQPEAGALAQLVFGSLKVGGDQRCTSGRAFLAFLGQERDHER